MEKNNLILFALISCGCALLACQPTVNNYEKFLNSWIGQSEAQLVTTWGAPADMQTLGQNRQLFTYIFQKQVLADLHQARSCQLFRNPNIPDAF